MKQEENQKSIYMDATKQSFRKLAPRTQLKNPVMFVVYLGAVLTTILYGLTFINIGDEARWYTFVIALVLWFTVLFANFAEAIAEGRGRAQANSLRSARKDVVTRKLKSADNHEDFTEVLSNTLKKGDIVIVEAGEQ
ncbi:potassium-transporting ATPase subunit B, partial [Listeria welshimeri]|nr:potassium-transporting ATPase subunit B [Listeria welshimeri]